MPPRRRTALGLRAALTFSCAVLVHGAVHAAGSRSFTWDTPAHGVMLAVALALLAGIAGPLGLVGPAAERRRRLALVRAALPQRTGAQWLYNAASQAALAVLLLGAEGASIDPSRLAVAVVCGLAALVLTSLLLHGCAQRVVAVLVALVATTARRERACVIRRRVPSLVRLAEPYRLFVPNRPPPIAV